jgi:hypothetical protein
MAKGRHQKKKKLPWLCRWFLNFGSDAYGGIHCITQWQPA